MDHIFQDLINTGKVSVYIDDIVIHTWTLEEHQCITKEVLEILWANKLYIKLERERKDWVPRSGSVRRESRDGSRQNRGFDKLANAKEVEGTPKFPRIL